MNKEMTNEVSSAVCSAIWNHMKKQPAIINCSVCGEPLNIYARGIDNDLNLLLDIDPCDCGEKIKEDNDNNN